MRETLDAATKTKLMIFPGNPNAYMISINSDSKAMIELINQGSDVLMNITVQNNCTAEELNNIIDLFTKYFYSNNPQVTGTLLRTDLNPMLESIGFKPLNEESLILYQKNNKTKESRRGEK